MSASWPDDEEELRAGGKGGFRAKTRFTFNEVRVLLEAVKRNRYIVLKKFNHGVSAETKKQTWTEITNRVNSLGENHREVRQIMKKWADLKCDGKRRIAALRGPNGSNLRKKKLGPVEKMVHKILMMSPRGDGESDPDLGEEDFSRFYAKGTFPNPPPYSYLSLTDSSHSLASGASVDQSPLSSPEKELAADSYHSSSDLDFADDGEQTAEVEEHEDAVFSSNCPPSSLDPLPDDALMRVKPVHTYSRNNNASSRPEPSSPEASTSAFHPASDSCAAPPHTASNMTVSSLPAPSSLAPPPASSSLLVAATDSTSHPYPSSSSIPLPPAVVSSSLSTTCAPSSSVPVVNSLEPPSTFSIAPPPPPTLASELSDPLPGGLLQQRSQDCVAQLASQSVQQQQASRMLLSSVSQSLEVLAQSVQLLVETQQEFVQESLLLQRETVTTLRDFSNTALTMLRDKTSSGQLETESHHHPPSHC